MLVTRSRLTHDLENLGLGPGGLVMVHCRMSALGHVVGGAETVVRALLDVVGPGGTLMAYTGWQDAPPDDLGLLDEAARCAYLEEHSPYDPRVALSSRDHGRVPEALRTWPGSRHSGHPEAGVAAIGPLADAITASHPYDAVGSSVPSRPGVRRTSDKPDGRGLGLLGSLVSRVAGPSPIACEQSASSGRLPKRRAASRLSQPVWTFLRRLARTDRKRRPRERNVPDLL